MSNHDWPFSDPPNVAVIANRGIFDENGWIAYVSHDMDDGAWQFHTNQFEPISETDATLVSLKSVVVKDPSVALLFDLPLGWHARRESRDAERKRVAMPNR